MTQVFNDSGSSHHAKKAAVFTREVASTEYHLSLLGEISDDAKVYEEHLQVLRQATESDTIYIHINSPGGSLSTAVQIVNCIQHCRADVIAVVESWCMSAATIIFLACRKWVVHGNIHFMVHCYSGGAFGTGLEIKKMAEAQHEWAAGVMRDYYKGFLTDEEIEKVVENNDTFWIGSDELKERLGNFITYLDEEDDNNLETLETPEN